MKEGEYFYPENLPGGELRTIKGTKELARKEPRFLFQSASNPRWDVKRGGKEVWV